ncbi:hypothetical protein EOPP23_12310 [Endozoicomonas sp. OPT23]|uniref:hypothetical protein n=1 Tax=Endozoicomonas sp. OPT23 TaxID=2072845 RepID=UPI00129B37C5|nr:hypothetical protein [Endozoicomonas sp. OPT23]MRI33768.1 hypothetical protein [Endozoicomonas sp. OPT23]
MSELKLRLVTTGNLASLEKVLHSSAEDGLKVSNFSAELLPERGHYEVTMSVSGFTSQNQVVSKLAMDETVRELTPIRR